jgi:hypothetical protein
LDDSFLADGGRHFLQRLGLEVLSVRRGTDDFRDKQLVDFFGGGGFAHGVFGRLTSASTV